MVNNQIVIKRIVRNAIVLSLYVVLTLIAYPISYGILQFRISEILILLCFFNRDYIIPLTLGCFLANLASPSVLLPWDLLIGTLATLLSCLIVSFCHHLLLAILFPILINSFMVASEFIIVGEDFNSFFWIVGMIMLGEAVVFVVSYIMYLLMLKSKRFVDLIDVKQNKECKW